MSSTALANISHSFEVSAGAGYTVLRPKISTAALVFESSHHSEFFPEGATSYVETPPEKWPSIDRHIGEMIGTLSTFAPVLVNNLSRVLIDPNRAYDAMNPRHIDQRTSRFPFNTHNFYTRSNVGLIPTTGIDAYDDPSKRPSTELLKERLKIWQLYHDTLDHLINQQWMQNGESLHLSMHSYDGKNIIEEEMRARSPIILSTLRHTSADPHVTSFLQKCFEDLGYFVLVNEIFEGGELVRQHGNPAMGKHSIQVEIERGLYMDTKTFERLPQGFNKLQNDLRIITANLCDFMNDRALTRRLEQTADAEPDQQSLAAE